MAKILAIRRTIPGELGDILVDADIYRPSGKGNVRVSWLLEGTNELKHWRVTGGCAGGLDLHSHGDILYMCPLVRDATYSHFLIGTDKG